MDIMMPGKNGYETIRNIREELDSAFCPFWHSRQRQWRENARNSWPVHPQLQMLQIL